MGVEHFAGGGAPDTDSADSPAERRAGGGRVTDTQDVVGVDGQDRLLGGEHLRQPGPEQQCHIGRGEHDRGRRGVVLDQQSRLDREGRVRIYADGAIRTVGVVLEPVAQHVVVGELEEDINDTTLTDTLRMAAVLQGRNYEGFSLVKYVFPDQNHCEVAAPGFQAGLKFALKKRG